MRDGLSLLDQVIASCGNQLDEKHVRQVLGVVPIQLLSDVLEAVSQRDARRVLELVGQLATEGYELGHFCGELTRTVRNLMVAKSCGADSSLMQVASDERARLAELAQLFSEEDLARFFNLLLRAESEMRYSLQPRFHLELGLMKLVHAQRLASLESLLSQLGQAAPPPKTMGAPAPRNQSATVPDRPALRATLRNDAVAQAVAEPVRALPVTVREDPLAGGVASPARTQPTNAPATAPSQERVAPGTSTQVSAETRATTKVAPTILATPAEDARLSSIKSTLFDQSKRFLSSCLDHLAGFRVEDGEVHFTFKHKDSLYADLLQAREQQEALRAVCTQVLGQPVRIYVTLEELRAESQAPRLSARERAERDPGVEAFRKRFDGVLDSVQDLGQE
jgi:DNA polymerase-3 subunit gamma/tau